MNERIRELMEQASSNACYDEPGQLHLMNNEFEKFAELLIENVLEIVENNRPDPDPYSERYLEQEYGERTANDIRNEIKYRFGVSE